MTLWMILTIMIAAAAVLISAPFIRRFERTRLASAEHLAVYRDQLTEIRREAAQGLIDTTQAESASVEIKRRIIAADRIAEASGRPFTRSERNFAVTAVTAIVIFGSIALYAVIGSPDLPSASPLQASNEPAAAPVMAPKSATSTLGMSRPGGGAAESRDPTQPQAGLPPVEEMIQRVQARLERSPKDADGWRLLGWSYFNIERFADAAQAYSRAIELRPESAEYRSARGEALVRAADGTVTPDARKDLDETLRLDPKDARARFFTGMAKEQEGNKEGAIADWNAIIGDADPNEPWLPELKQRLAGLQRGSDGAAAPPSRPSLTAGNMQELLRADRKTPEAPAERGPTTEDVRRADAMSSQDRTAMIRGMVDGLATRLEQSPRDAEGWIKLIRSRAVLGEAELAKQSLQRALSVFAEDSAERTRIADAAKQLGIEP